ncbi:hypothetical protein [Halorhodospira halophila]|uniref:hypothetical protein n=1 Tax=Halorhodospira halophila TaxID=1053 RepID=UPI0011981ED1|nr:hypothetical protein [Halorhodospira halophila]
MSTWGWWQRGFEAAVLSEPTLSCRGALVSARRTATAYDPYAYAAKEIGVDLYTKPNNSRRARGPPY